MDYPLTPDDACLHEALYFGSGDYYLICKKCNRFWAMLAIGNNQFAGSDRHNQGAASGLSGIPRVAQPDSP